ncbi:MAG: hypothetical protein HZA51_12710 [Planctomycetes bacterium]|nr:hypothetical protein [Planctomycetota bacterium]
MKLPNSERAVVDIGKLRGYCLNPDHLRGRHKARVFASVLGITADNADLLRDAIIQAASTEDALVAEKDGFGQRYVLDFHWQNTPGEPLVRTTWIVRQGEDFPRLTSCYVR